MRILFTIPHFFNPDGDGKHASLSKDPRPRITGLVFALTALRELYSQSQCMIDIAQCQTIPVNQEQNYQVDIVICTTQDYHLLAQIPLTFMVLSTLSYPGRTDVTGISMSSSFA